MWMKWIHFLPLNSYQCTRGLRTRIWLWLEILLSGFAPSGEAMVSRAPPGRKGHVAYECSAPLAPSFSLPLTSQELWDFIGSFICFSLFDPECGSFIHVVGNIYVAGDLVVSLSFLWWYLLCLYWFILSGFAIFQKFALLQGWFLLQFLVSIVWLFLWTIY